VDNQPVGGTRFPDAVLPLGVLTPASVPPVTTRLITETCGNLGGFRPFTAAELARRYGTADRYLQGLVLIAAGLHRPTYHAGSRPRSGITCRSVRRPQSSIFRP
jgi:Alpha/beta hydrolase domain